MIDGHFQIWYKLSIHSKTEVINKKVNNTEQKKAFYIITHFKTLNIH